MKSDTQPSHYIEVRGLSKKFGYKTVLRNIDISLQEGDTLALFGPNGAGKSTLIQILAMLLTPSSGTLRIAGYDANRDRDRLHGLIGLLSHQSLLYPHLTAYENLKFYGIMYGVAGLDDRIRQVMEIVGMTDYRNDLVQHFSRGMQQRLSLARAIIHEPPILFLDEPFTGLDPQGSEDLKKLIGQFCREGKTMVMALHDLPLGLELCGSAAIMKSGRIVYMEEVARIPRNDFPAIYARQISGQSAPLRVAS